MKIELRNKEKITCRCTPVGKNLLEIRFDGEILDHTLFGDIRCLNAHDKIIGKYEGYTTIYKELEDGFILSNDGSVYVEPEVPEIVDPIIPDPEEPIVPAPTLEERITDMEKWKNEVETALMEAVNGGE